MGYTQTDATCCLDHLAACAQVYLYFLCWGAQCIIHAPTRTAMRNKYGLKEAPCSDCCVTFLCARPAASDQCICGGLSPVHHAQPMRARSLGQGKRSKATPLDQPKLNRPLGSFDGISTL